MTDTLPPLPDAARAAFEAWLNPGRHSGNVSPWVPPGRYEKETHQLAWLAWQAAVAAEREKCLDAMKQRLSGTVMSKYLSTDACEAARAALRNAMLDVWGA